MRDWQQWVREHLPPLEAGREREAEIVAELALQLEQCYQDALAGGATEDEAARRARAQFRDWSKLGREINREIRGNWFSGGLHDLRFAFRCLGRNPGFAVIAVATLAFGIGGNTAIFTMVDALALRRLPYRAPERLAAIETRKTEQPELEPWTSALDFFDAREQLRSFESVAAISPIWDMVLTGRGPAERLQALFVSADLFPMLGAAPAAGRLFLPSEDRRTQPSPAVVISHALWQRRFGGRPGAVGQSLALDNGVYTVIGVLPPDFQYLGEPLAGTAAEIDVWLPLADNPLTPSVRGLRFLKVIGRLRPGVSTAQAGEEIRRFGASLAERYPESNRGYVWNTQPLAEQVAGRIRTTMLLLLGAVGFVLLMACANVANLLLTRAAARQREISVRIALGASWVRLLRQLLAEGLVLALAGGAAGLPLAYLGLRLLVAIGPERLVHHRAIQMDTRALLFTAALVLAAAILAGLPPAWRVLRAEIGHALREAGRGLTAGHHGVRAALVGGQVGLAMVLLVGSGLLIRSFQRLLDVNPGFDAHRLVTISTQVPPSAQTGAQRTAIYRTIRDRLLAVPGVDEVAAVSRLPLMGRNLGVWVYIEGKSVPGAPLADVEYRVATPSYFHTMGIPLRAGRLFDDHDDATAGSMAVINETMACKFWRGESPLGSRVRLGANPKTAQALTVIGVVGDIRHEAMETEPRPEIYRPYAVNPLTAPVLVVRTRVDPAAIVTALGDTVRSIGPEVPAYDVFRMDALVDRSTQQRRFVMLLLTVYAIAALLLAGVGIYGTVSQAVQQRTREIGLRMALGASPGEVLQMVFGQGMRVVAIGAAAGALAAAGLTGLMRSLLFEVRPLDPLAFAAAVFTLAVFALLACYLPARRATRVDPLVALRHDG